MVSLDDVVSDLESNGNKIISIEGDGTVYIIKYIDSSSSEHTVRYRVDISDDGSEELTHL